MIYSSWNPAGGKYTYWSVPGEQYGIGDDLPSPRLPGGTAIGVASTEAGRPLPAGAKRVGSGEFAKGVIAPLDRRGLTRASGPLSAVGFIAPSGPALLLLAASFAAGYASCKLLPRFTR